MHSPSLTIPHDALLVLSRAKNGSLYQRLIDGVSRRRKPSLHMCNGVNFRDRYLDTPEIQSVIADRSARVLAVIDAPAQDFCDYPVLRALYDLKQYTHAALDLALVIDIEWSNSIKEKPFGRRAAPPFDFPNRPEVYRDVAGPTQLMDAVRTRHPDITQIHVTDATIADQLDAYLNSLI